MHYAWEVLADGVHRCRLPFLDVTVGLVVGSAAVLLIDCGTTLSEAERLAGDVVELTGRPVSDVVLTHHHFDHILGSAGFPEARLHCAEPVMVALTRGITTVRDHAVSYGADRGEIDRTVARLRAPDHTVARLRAPDRTVARLWAPDRTVCCTRIDLGDRVVHIDHPGRGHTDHDLAVVVPPRGPGDRPVVFCGDLVEESADPAVDEGSDLAAWPAAIERLLQWGGSDGVYVPGHGAVVDAGFLAGQRDWLRRAGAEKGL
ncbi:MAG TPA: MBL fold metallo-hydrolase [Mycobacterium sp.]|nr:MBL fold metallo-hydrolase [Mycobacterium sp.]HPZ95288.1 MBL fold metallo-hydrolase [Mycobacterium sp.]HQE15894.1 MBL fold metallo-hydrolase [Mycobacterium sp.]